MSQDNPPQQAQSSKRVLAGQIAAYGIAAAIVISMEVAEFQGLDSSQTGIIGWLFGSSIDKTTLYFLLLESIVFLPLIVLAPLFWWLRSRRSVSVKIGVRKTERESAASSSRAGWRTWPAAILVAATSLTVSAPASWPAATSSSSAGPSDRPIGSATD